MYSIELFIAGMVFTINNIHRVLHVYKIQYHILLDISVLILLNDLRWQNIRS